MRILAIDVGTTRTKAAIYTDRLERLALRDRPTRAVAADGVVDAARLVEDAFAVGADAVAAWRRGTPGSGEVGGPATPGLVRAGGATQPGAGSTNVGSTTTGPPNVDAVVVTAIMGYALLDTAGTVLSARAWNDRRCASEAARLAEELERAGVDPGRPVGPELLAPHLLWLASAAPGTFAAVASAIGLKDLVVRELTGAQRSGEPGVKSGATRRSGAGAPGGPADGPAPAVPTRSDDPLPTDFSHRDYSLLLDRSGVTLRAVRAALEHAAGERPAAPPPAVGAPPRAVSPTAAGLRAAGAWWGAVAAALAAALPAHTVIGAVAPGAAARLGVPAGAPVVLGSSDGTAAMYGAGVLAGESMSMVTGSTDVVMTRADDRPEMVSAAAEAGLSVNAAMVEGAVLTGGSTGASGASLAWWSERFGGAASGASPADGAGGAAGGAPPGLEWQSVSPGAAGVMVAPSFGGERAPFYRGGAGIISGLTLEHTAADVARAIVEANAFRLALLAERVAVVVPGADRRILAGGGSTGDAIDMIRAALFSGSFTRLPDPELSLTGSVMFAVAALAGDRADRDATLVRLGREAAARGRPVEASAEARSTYARFYGAWRERIDAMLDLAERIGGKQ